MYNRIIENLDEAVIVENKKIGIQYFNTKGLYFLKMAAGIINNPAHIEFLENLNQKIYNFEPSRPKTEEESEILKAKVFRLLKKEENNEPFKLFSF
tara:strand:- start:3926 stop:4213 length:288 start_codon:yes stop_codon:yes gene_type:complete